METQPPSQRIAIFFHDLSLGGAERVMLQLAQGFSELGYSVDLVLASAEGPLLSEEPSKARIINLDTRTPLVMLVKLVKYLRAEKPEVLLSPFEVTSVIALLARKISRARTRIVVRISVNLSMNKRTRLKKIIERLVVSRLYPMADGIVTVSHGVADDLVTYTGIPLDRIKVIYNPVISDRLVQAMEHPVDHPYFVEQNHPVVLGVGRFTEQKDFPTLIKAFDIVRQRVPSRLVILGDGDGRRALEELVNSLGLKGWVDLPGFTLNPFSFMHKASVFVLSSKWEGLPGVLIQALACGCPTVSTDCPSGPAEILRDGQYGYLVPVGDVEAMAEQITAVLAGNIRKPPQAWLQQFETDVVLQQYKAVLCI